MNVISPDTKIEVFHLLSNEFIERKKNASGLNLSQSVAKLEGSQIQVAWLFFHLVRFYGEKGADLVIGTDPS